MTQYPNSFVVLSNLKDLCLKFGLRVTSSWNLLVYITNTAVMFSGQDLFVRHLGLSTPPLFINCNDIIHTSALSKMNSVT